MTVMSAAGWRGPILSVAPRHNFDKVTVSTLVAYPTVRKHDENGSAG